MKHSAPPDEFPAPSARRYAEVVRENERLGRELIAARATEHKLSLAQVALDHAADAVFWLAADGRILYVNDNACNAIGYGRDELLAMSVFDIRPDIRAEQWHQRWDEIKNATTATTETVLVSRDGREVPVEIVLSYVAIDDTEFLCGFARGLGARLRRQEALRESEERFRRIFEDGPTPMGIIDADGHFVKMNDAFCKLLGYTEEELRELTIPDISHADDMPLNRKYTAQMFADEISSYRMEKRYIRKDGSTIWVNLTGAGIRDAQGRTRHGVGIVEDITERRRAEERVRSLTALKSDFVTLASHELRAPLTNINGTIELMSADADLLPDSTRRSLEILAAQTMRLTKLVESLLDISRLDAGHMPMTLRPVAVDVIARRVIESLSQTAGGAPPFRLEVEGHLPLAWADETHVHQVFENLLRNAVKYGGTEAPIDVRTRVDGGRVAVSITDHGPGIRREDQAQVFDAFFRVAGSAEGEGYGVGLYFVRRLLEAQGGTIALRSPAFEDAAGPGAEFTFTLPTCEGR